MAAKWMRAARADLARIHDFNVQLSEAYAAQVDARLLERADALERTPRIGRPAGKTGLRALSVVDIQYVITYARIGDEITIFRVHHTREHRGRP